MTSSRWFVCWSSADRISEYRTPGEQVRAVSLPPASWAAGCVKAESTETRLFVCLICRSEAITRMWVRFTLMILHAAADGNVRRYARLAV